MFSPELSSELREILDAVTPRFEENLKRVSLTIIHFINYVFASYTVVFIELFLFKLWFKLKVV